MLKRTINGSRFATSVPMSTVGFTQDEAAHAAASAHTSATIDNVVAIRGGGIPLDQNIANSWVVQPRIINGRRFVEIYAHGGGRAMTYVQHKWDMVKHMKALRDAKTRELMRAVLPQTDPNEENPAVTSVSDRPRRELIDQIPPFIDIEVGTRNGIRVTVNVVPSWRQNMALQIELTRENIELLLEDPPAGSARFVPSLAAFPNVSWIGDRNHVRTVWWESKRRIWKITSRRVEIAPDTTNHEAEQLVLAAAADLESFYAAHHNQDDNMRAEDEEPPARRRAMSNDGMSLSAESAHE